ncbi:Set1 complex component spp1 [Colletotrichum chlorophyti]|uniref:Set1 complex component spp1 n=1 Tax=Colletotrichum chlorophyti TaxID=708187 RepID=A0A1Q8S4P6_9PEZI|nr:Set1 complex component spp1 [Colletotrichum chlorophyti]
MDSDVEQKVKEDEGRQGEDLEMADAPTQIATGSLPTSQVTNSNEKTDSKIAPPPSEQDTLPPSTQTTTTDPTSPAANPTTTTILESTEKPAESQKMAPKKKGTAAVKKIPKRPKGSGPRSGRPKKQTDTTSVTTTNSQEEAAGGSDDESDHGPYCICRGPDDHRFMISCDVCEDWFHGECVNIAKDVGENLIERFVCPNCTDGDKNASLFKKTCGLEKCMKPARLYGDGERSVFCSDDHKQLWWERKLSALPKKASSKKASQNGLTQEEMMGLLTSELSGVDASDGKWKVNTRPFASPPAGAESPEAKSKTLAPGVLTEEEVSILKDSAAERYKMGEDVVLCQKMLQLLDWANDRRKALVASKQLDDAGCGYDYRLDQVGVVGPFRHWLNNSDEAKEVFKAGNLDVGSQTSGDEKNFCDKKRCKAHQGWFSLHTRDVKYAMKLLAADANKNLDNERRVKEAAAERKLRKEAEHNTVRRVGPDGALLPPEVM